MLQPPRAESPSGIGAPRSRSAAAKRSWRSAAGGMTHLLPNWFRYGRGKIGFGALGFVEQRRPVRQIVVPFDQRRQRTGGTEGPAVQRPDGIGDLTVMGV